MNNFKNQAILLFIAVEDKRRRQNNTVKTVNCKNKNEVDEFTEIWELVKKKRGK